LILLQKVSCRSICVALEHIVEVVASVSAKSINIEALHKSINQFGEAVSKLLEYICTKGEILGDGLKVSVTTQELLYSRAKSVQTATDAIVKPAKSVAGLCADPTMQHRIITAAKLSVYRSSQFVVTVRLLAATINLPNSAEALKIASNRLISALRNLLTSASNAINDEQCLAHLKGEIELAISELSRFESVVTGILQGTKAKAPQTRGKYNELCDSVIAVADGMSVFSGNTPKLVTAATKIAKAASLLVGAIKADAKCNKDAVQHKRLNWIARAMVDMTSQLVKSAKAAAKNEKSSDLRSKLLRAGQELGGQAMHVKELQVVSLR